MSNTAAATSWETSVYDQIQRIALREMGSRFTMPRHEVIRAYQLELEAGPRDRSVEEIALVMVYG